MTSATPPQASPTRPSPAPVEVRRLRAEKRLRITWADRAVTEVDYRTARGYCPCAGCQGHLVREIVFKPPRGEVDLFVIEPVGNYALSFLWSDGHHTGIYRYEFLRTLPERDAQRREREQREERAQEENGPAGTEEPATSKGANAASALEKAPAGAPGEAPGNTAD